MYRTHLRKVGGSVMLAIPPALLELLSLRSGDRVGITVEGGRLVVEPRKRPRYTLDELIAQGEPGRSRSRWLRGGAVGRELI